MHGGSELTGGRLTAMWSAVLVGGGRAAGQMPKLVVGALVDQGRLARITLPDGAEVLRSTAAGSLERRVGAGERRARALARVLHTSSNLTSTQTIYLSRAAVPQPSTETIYLC